MAHQNAHSNERLRVYGSLSPPFQPDAGNDTASERAPPEEQALTCPQLRPLDFDGREEKDPSMMVTMASRIMLNKNKNKNKNRGARQYSFEAPIDCQHGIYSAV